MMLKKWKKKPIVYEFAGLIWWIFSTRHAIFFSMEDEAFVTSRKQKRLRPMKSLSIRAQEAQARDTRTAPLYWR